MRLGFVASLQRPQRLATPQNLILLNHRFTLKSAFDALEWVLAIVWLTLKNRTGCRYLDKITLILNS